MTSRGMLQAFAQRLRTDKVLYLVSNGAVTPVDLGEYIAFEPWKVAGVVACWRADTAQAMAERQLRAVSDGIVTIMQRRS